MSQPKDFQVHIQVTLPVGSEVETPEGLATVLFHTENMERELTGLRVKLADGTVGDISYSAVLSPEWQWHPTRPGRPVERNGDYQRITLEVRRDLLAKMDASGKSRREYIETLLENQKDF